MGAIALETAAPQRSRAEGRGADFLYIRPPRVGLNLPFLGSLALRAMMWTSLLFSVAFWFWLGLAMVT